MDQSIKIIAGIYARNEGEHIAWVLHHLMNQSLKITGLVFLNDGSTDHTEERVFEAVDGSPEIPVYYHREKPHENYAQNGKLYLTYNKLWDLMLEHEAEYYLILGGDTVLPLHYLEMLTYLMYGDPLPVAIASGSMHGEYTELPRGSGRLHHGDFMKYSCPDLPENSVWETYPLYKALSMGLAVRCYEKPVMIPIRATARKAEDGASMRELGYHPLYAYLRCLKAMISSRKDGVSMLRSYRQKGLKVYDSKIRDYLHQAQMRSLLHPRRLMKRL